MMLTLKPIHYASVWAMWMVEELDNPLYVGTPGLDLDTRLMTSRVIKYSSE